MSKAEDITDYSFSDIINQSNLVVVDFWASWCGVCRKFESIIETTADEMTNIKFVKMEVDKSPVTAEKYSVTGLPTVLIFKNGELVERITSAIPKSKLIEIVNKYEK